MLHIALIKKISEFSSLQKAQPQILSFHFCLQKLGVRYFMQTTRTDSRENWMEFNSSCKQLILAK
jgi:hypothetical protein